MNIRGHWSLVSFQRPQERSFPFSLNTTFHPELPVIFFNINKFCMLYFFIGIVVPWFSVKLKYDRAKMVDNRSWNRPYVYKPSVKPGFLCNALIKRQGIRPITGPLATPPGNLESLFFHTYLHKNVTRPAWTRVPSNLINIINKWLALAGRLGIEPAFLLVLQI